MNRRELKIRETMARVARVRDQRAASRLSAAISVERQKKEQLDEVAHSRDAVSDAGRRCLARDEGLDLARYALLSDLQGIMDVRVDRAEQSLAAAATERKQCVAERLDTKVRHDRAGEEAARYRQSLYQDIEKRQSEQAMELWLQSGDMA